MRHRLRKIIKITSVVFVLSLVILLFFASIQYRGLKKILVVRISDKATAFIGQKVEIEDLSLSLSAGINLYNIRIKNPEGFAAGDLLRIRKLFLKMKYGDLSKGKLSFGNITVHSPELTVLRDDHGRMNISEELMKFFKKKPTLTYQIDEFEIKSGSADFNRNEYLQGNEITISLKNISSEPGNKTTFQGNLSFSQIGRIAIDGGAYLKDDPKRLNLSLTSGDISLIPLKQLLSRYGISAEKTKVSFRLDAEGDTEKGIRLKSEVGIKEAGFSFFKKDVKDIRLNMRAFLNIMESAFSVEDVSLFAGGVAAATVKGELRKAGDDVAYTVFPKISRLDLAAFNFMRDVGINGIVTSRNLHVQGSLKKRIPEISGVIQLSEGALRSQDMDIGKINARITFSQGKGMAVRAEATARISKAKGYLLEKPAEADIRMNASGDPKNVELLSSVNVSPIAVRLKSGKTVHVENLGFRVKSNIKGKVFSGESRVDMKGIQYDTYQIPWLRSNAILAYNGNIIRVKTPTLEGKDFTLSAKQLMVTLPKTTNTVIMEMEDMNASYPGRKAEIRKTALSLKLNTGGKALSGDLGFSIGETLFKGVRTGSIRGSGGFDDKYFFLDITGAEVSGGSIKLSAKGRSSEGPFPLTLTASAENINLGNLSEEALKMANIPYVISGNVKNIIFEGTVNSKETVQGKAEIQAEKISLLNKERRNIVQGVSLKGGLLFRGNDFDFTSHVHAGKISTDISGTVNRFMQKGRMITAKIIQPEMNITDIRETFWDTFPDSLLYAGLEGTLSSDVTIQSDGRDIKAAGTVSVKDVLLRGENDEYSVGPVNGVMPVAYEKSDKPAKDLQMYAFERPEFENLVREYSRKTFDDRYHKITVGSFHYGFELLNDITLWVKQEGNVLNVGRVSGNIFGGKLNGSAVVDISNGLMYRAGLLVEGMSFMKLCEGIEPIKGYLSGKVSGVVNIKGTGTGLADLIGKAEAWTYSTSDEKTKISKEFLQKIGGPSLKAYLGDRKFDKGNMSVYLQNGYIIFRELEISNRNLFGMQDLSIKVAPLSNRIAIDHLMWAIVEAASRAKKK